MQPLSTPFNIAVQCISNIVLPMGFDISPNAPGTFEEITAYHAKTGRVCVWDGASDNTIFADAGINHAFRAWHDSKHILNGYDFTREGEIATARAQQSDIRALYDGSRADAFCAILWAEVVGQFEYAEYNGGFPVDQFSFVELYLAHPRTAALGNEFGVSNVVITRKESAP